MEIPDNIHPCYIIHQFNPAVDGQFDMEIWNGERKAWIKYIVKVDFDWLRWEYTIHKPFHRNYDLHLVWSDFVHEWCVDCFIKHVLDKDAVRYLRCL